jgi:hypothetical protein
MKIVLESATVTFMINKQIKSKILVIFIMIQVVS